MNYHLDTHKGPTGRRTNMNNCALCVYYKPSNGMCWAIKGDADPRHPKCDYVPKKDRKETTDGE